MRLLFSLLGAAALVEAFGPPARATTRPLTRADFSPIDFSLQHRSELWFSCGKLLSPQTLNDPFSDAWIPQCLGFIFSYLKIDAFLLVVLILGNSQ